MARKPRVPNSGTGYLASSGSPLSQNNPLPAGARIPEYGRDANFGRDRRKKVGGGTGIGTGGHVPTLPPAPVEPAYTPVLEPIPVINLVDTVSVDTFPVTNGQLVASDRNDTDVLVFSIFEHDTDSTPDTDAFDQQKVSPYGLLQLNTATGAYRFTPDAPALNALHENASYIYNIRVADPILTAMQDLVINIFAVEDFVAPTLTLSNLESLGNVIPTGDRGIRIGSLVVDSDVAITNTTQNQPFWLSFGNTNITDSETEYHWDTGPMPPWLNGSLSSSLSFSYFDMVRDTDTEVSASYTISTQPRSDLDTEFLLSGSMLQQNNIVRDSTGAEQFVSNQGAYFSIPDFSALGLGPPYGSPWHIGPVASPGNFHLIGPFPGFAAIARTEWEYLYEVHNQDREANFRIVANDIQERGPGWPDGRFTGSISWDETINTRFTPGAQTSSTVTISFDNWGWLDGYTGSHTFTMNFEANYGQAGFSRGRGFEHSTRMLSDSEWPVVNGAGQRIDFTFFQRTALMTNRVDGNRGHCWITALDIWPYDLNPGGTGANGYSFSSQVARIPFSVMEIQ